ncbi:hypothetical protein DFH11DRAFT_672688 [Phellopilus nigrolimitatus]|nr:hypothetical protein DFH11DRAFT_672688 [Phellopilus nigrolimitatus]
MEKAEHTQTLSYEALLKKSMGDRSDKSSLVKAFIWSQKQYASIYASEGKKESLQWLEKSDSEVYGGLLQGSVPQTKTPGGGFSSPILKPRNAVAHFIAKSPSCISVSSTSITTKRKACAEVYQGVMRPGSTRRKATQTVKNPTKKPKSAHMASNSTNIPVEISKKEIRNKRRRSDSDEEKEERLVQRRARRQRKKSIMSPKENSKESVAASEEDNEDVPISNNERKSNTSKGGKRKLPAGLALMHGFSAKNIGKHRLTAGLGSMLGVFNKGRASAKTTAEKKSKANIPIVFNETVFLNKTLIPSKHARDVKDSRTRTETTKTHSSTMTSIGGQRSLIQQKPDAVDDYTAKISTKPVTISTASASLSPSQKLNEHSEHDSKSSYESEVWEIEREFLQDPDPQSRKVVASPSKPKSIVMDSRACNWSLPQIVHSASDSRQPSILQIGHSLPTGKKRSSTFNGDNNSSLAPSESASQIPAKIHTIVSTGSPRLKSKFFASLVSKSVDCNQEKETQSLPETPPFCPERRSSRVMGDTPQTQPMTDFPGCDIKDTTVLSALEDEVRKLVFDEQWPLSFPGDFSVNAGPLSVATADYTFHERTPYDDVRTSQSILLAALEENHDNYNQHDPASFDDYYSCAHVSGLASPSLEMVDSRDGGRSEDFMQNYVVDVDEEYNISQFPENMELEDTGYGYEAGQSRDDNNAGFPFRIGIDTEFSHAKDENAFQLLCNSVISYGSENHSLEEWESDSFVVSEDGVSESCNKGVSYQLVDSFDSEQNRFTETRMSAASFLQGRALLLGMESAQSMEKNGLENRSCYDFGSIEDAESVVAREIQRHWYPVKL